MGTQQEPRCTAVPTEPLNIFKAKTIKKPYRMAKKKHAQRDLIFGTTIGESRAKTSHRGGPGYTSGTTVKRHFFSFRGPSPISAPSPLPMQATQFRHAEAARSRMLHTPRNDRGTDGERWPACELTLLLRRFLPAATGGFLFLLLPPSSPPEGGDSPTFEPPVDEDEEDDDIGDPYAGGVGFGGCINFLSGE